MACLTRTRTRTRTQTRTLTRTLTLTLTLTLTRTRTRTLTLALTLTQVASDATTVAHLFFLMTAVLACTSSYTFACLNVFALVEQVPGYRVHHSLVRVHQDGP